MRIFKVILLFLLLSIKASTQFKELVSNTGTLTPHWKKLPFQAKPAFLNGKYYTKLDDETFISTDGTTGGTLKLNGFSDVKSIANYVATSNFLYYTLYKGGKIYINRYDPVTQQHTTIKNGSKLLEEEDRSILVFSAFSNKLVVSCWEWNPSFNRTITKLYAIHDNDIAGSSWLISASSDQNGILDGSVGLSDDQVIARFNMVKAGQETKQIIYAFGFKDTLTGFYKVGKEYDFTQIGLVINSLVGFGSDVLFVLNNKLKLAAKEPAGSVWLLRNKSARKLGDLPVVKSNSLKEAYPSGDVLFLVFEEGVYSYKSQTGVLKNELVFQPGESLGMMASNEYLQRIGDTLWFRTGTKLPNGSINYKLQFLNLVTGEKGAITDGIAPRFATEFLFDRTSVYYPYFNGSNIYYLDNFLGNGAQLYQYSIATGKATKIMLPEGSNTNYEGITEVVKLGSVLLIKAHYKGEKGTAIKTFLYNMP